VNQQLKSDNRKLAFFKEHQGKFHQKNELTKKLEETINTILSGKTKSILLLTKKNT
jgi:hypothetical protein